MQYCAIFTDEREDEWENKMRSGTRRSLRREDFYHGSILVLCHHPPLVLGTPFLLTLCSFYSQHLFHFLAVSLPRTKEVTWHLLFAFLSYWRKYLIKFPDDAPSCPRPFTFTSLNIELKTSHFLDSNGLLIFLWMYLSRPWKYFSKI